jgi:hypothetical protein
MEADRYIINLPPIIIFFRPTLSVNLPVNGNKEKLVKSYEGLSQYVDY